MEAWLQKEKIMPYIKQEDRDKLLDEIVELELKLQKLRTIRTEDGNLNYVMTRLLHNEIDYRGKCYKTLNSLIGVLECCKLELYRRIVVDYEDEKIAEDGDVL